MKSLLALPLVVVGSVALTGCFDGDDDPLKSSVRVIHASSDAPAVNVNVNGQTVVSGADYKQVAVLSPRVGPASISIDGLLPGGDTATVIDANTAFRLDTEYDVIAVGKVGDQTIEPLVLTDDGSREDANSVRLRVAHLSPDAEEAAAGPVDVYVTAAGAELPAEATFSFSFKESVGPLEVPAGEYQIRVTPAGDASTVVFDSGTVPLPAGADLLIGAVDNTGISAVAESAASSPVSLIVVNGGDVSEIYDVNQLSGARVVHNSPDAPAVDVLVNDEVAISNLAFSEVAPAASLDSYAGIPAGEQNVKVTPTGSTTPVVIEADLDFAQGTGNTVIAYDLVSQIKALVLTDSVRSIATQATVRVVHGSTIAGPVDIFLLPEGIEDTANAAPVLADVPFGANSGYLPVIPGTYNLVVQVADGNAAIGPIEVTLDAGGIYTVIARDTQALDGADLIVLDDSPIP